MQNNITHWEYFHLLLLNIQYITNITYVHLLESSFDGKTYMHTESFLHYRSNTFTKVNDVKTSSTHCCLNKEDRAQIWAHRLCLGASVAPSRPQKGPESGSGLGVRPELSVSLSEAQVLCRVD